MLCPNMVWVSACEKRLISVLLGMKQHARGHTRAGLHKKTDEVLEFLWAIGLFNGLCASISNRRTTAGSASAACTGV